MEVIIGILLYLKVITASSTVTVSTINLDVNQHSNDINQIMLDGQKVDNIMQTYRQDIQTVIVIDDTTIR